MLQRSGQEATVTDSLRSLCDQAGLDFDALKPDIVQRLTLLARDTATLHDAQRALDMAERIFEHYAAKGRPFAELEKSTVLLGTLFSDIGKTGPVGASPHQQRLIAEMFAVEGVPSGSISVRAFLQQYFPNDAPQRLVTLASLGLDAEMSIREFWNLHTGWTLQVTQEAGVPPEAIAAASTHHLLENVNPETIVTSDDRFSQDFGLNLAFDRAEKLVIVLDKYDAVRRRSALPHSGAIDWLRKHIARHPRYRDDTEFKELVDALDTLMLSNNDASYTR